MAKMAEGQIRQRIGQLESAIARVASTKQQLKENADLVFCPGPYPGRRRQGKARCR